MTAKAAVVGWPIQHSLSPVLHGHWLREYGIDGTYEKIAIEPGTFPQRIAELREAGYRGVNVTVPFKEEAFALATEITTAARIVEAANLLVFLPDGSISGKNTDGFGLQHDLRQQLGQHALSGATVVLLGAGGAARGALLALQAVGAAKIHILNRNVERAKQLALSVGPEISARMSWGPLSDWSSVASNTQLALNTTSAGMSGNEPLEIDLSFLPEDAAVCDIVYKPLLTPLLEDAKRRGHKTIDGLGMLMHQAAPSFRDFFNREMGGRMPEVTSALRTVLESELKSRG